MVGGGDLLIQSRKSVVMRYHAAQPFPDALLRIQFGQVGWLGREREAPVHLTDDLCRALTLRGPETWEYSVGLLELCRYDHEGYL